MTDLRYVMEELGSLIFFYIVCHEMYSLKGKRGRTKATDWPGVV